MNRDVGLDLPPDGSMDTGPRQATVHGVPGVGHDLATKPPPPPMAQTSLVAQTVKNLPATQETRAQSLDQEDPLEKGMTTHSSILALTNYAWAAKTHSTRGLEWGTFRYSRGRLRPT